MKRDGWWVSEADDPGVEKRMRQRLVREVLESVFRPPAPVRDFVATVMARKRDDHRASHSDKANQALHLVSSSVFICCYAIIFTNMTVAMCLGLAALFVRQFGHAVLEPPCHEKEATLLGFNTPKKTLIVLGYTLIPFLVMMQASDVSLGGFVTQLDEIARRWFHWTVFVVLGRVVYLTWRYDAEQATIWFVKLVTDPFTDIVAYFPTRLVRVRH